MSIVYHIYAGNNAGGPVDYGTVVATVGTLTWATPPLPLGSDTTFALRAYDSVGGLEEKNVDARVRVVIDAAGVDVTHRPNAPTGLIAEPRAGGKLRVTWLYNPGGQGAAPTGFHVYVGSPTPNYGAVAATYPYTTGRVAFATELTGLASGAYQVAVRAYNATGEEPNTAVVAATVDATGPDPVDNLAAAAAT